MSDVIAREIIPSACGSLVIFYYLYVYGYSIPAPGIEAVNRQSPIICLLYAYLWYAAVSYIAALWIFGAIDERHFFLASISVTALIGGRNVLIVRSTSGRGRHRFVTRIAAG